MLNSIRAKIALLAIVPLLAYAIASIIALNEAYSEKKIASDIYPTALVAERAEAVLHELQKERGRTAVLLASDYAAGPRSALDKQRQATDKAVADLKAEVDGFYINNTKLLDAIVETSTGLDAIGAHRAGIDSKSIKGSTNLAFYSGKVRDLITLVQGAVQASADNTYAEQMVPFLALTEAIEAGGLERAIGGQLFTIVANTGEVPADRFLAYFDRLAVETAFLNNFQRIATPEQLAAFDQKVCRTGSVDQVTEWRKVLRTLAGNARTVRVLTGPSGSARPRNVSISFATRRIVMLKAAEARALEIAAAASIRT